LKGSKRQLEEGRVRTSKQTSKRPLRDSSQIGSPNSASGKWSAASEKERQSPLPSAIPPRRSPESGTELESDDQRPKTDERPFRVSAAPPRPGAHKGSPVILYEDDEIIAVDKPAGLPTIAPEGSRGKSLYGFVTNYIQRRNPRGRAAVVHRIDRDTSGVVIFGKSAQTKRTLMSAWNDLVVSRRYVALVEGIMESPSGTLASWLRENRGGTVYETPPGVPGSLRAVTHWRLLESGGGFSLLELELETGRKHQIRAQLAAAGHPVAGDPRYGARTDPAGRLTLHAASIELSMPHGEAIRVESPVPESFFKPLRGREKSLYYGASKVGDRSNPPRRAKLKAPGADKDKIDPSPPGGGYMKDKSKQAKEPKKKPLKTLKEKRKEKKDKAANKVEE
jgi:23S rRNA pseudouridine1911/1915/1917 synthase